MTKLDTSVKWFHSGMPGAPVLRGQPGALIELLDACLINGFDTRNINSIIVSGGVAIATLSGGHTYQPHSVIRIQGVTGALDALNDEWRIATVTASTVAFACPGLPDGSASGTITALYAPAGWEKPFSGSNLAVYRSGSIFSTQFSLRVNDANSRYTYVRGYEQMSDADTGTGLFPTLGQLIDSSFIWCKSSSADAVSRHWVVVADESLFYVLPDWHQGYPNTGSLYWFGDIDRWSAGDSFPCAIVAHANSGPFSPITGISSHYLSGNSLSGDGSYLARPASGAGGPVTSMRRGAWGISNSFGTSYPLYTSAVDQRLHLHRPIVAFDGAGSGTNQPRGSMPGLLQPLQSALPFASRTVVDAGASGRVLISTIADTGAGSARVAFDIFGPWR